MKIKSIYIDGFGALSNYTLDFSETLTSICESNGYGKSTLAAFIKAIFYGLKTSKKNEKELSERKHYCPFSGGSFGGSIVFEHKGKICKIERVFDKKSDTADTCTVYINGNETNELGEKNEIGEALFGVDADSFEKTAFFSEKATEISITGSIGKSLNASSTGILDDGNYEKAIKKLDEAIKELKNSRGKGKIGAKQDEIVSLSLSISELKSSEKELNRLHYDRNETSNALNGIKAKIASADELKRLAEKYAELELKKSKISKKAEECKTVLEKYESNPPSADEISAIKKKLEEYNKSTSAASVMEAKNTAEGELIHAREFFKSEIPSENEADALSDYITELEKIEIPKFSDEKNSRIQKLKEFLGKAPEHDLYNDENMIILSDILADVCENPPKKLPNASDAAEIIRLKNQLPAPMSMQSSAPKKSKPALITAILSALLITVGIGISFVIVPVGTALLAAGLILLALDGFLYLKNNIINTQAPQASDMQVFARLSVLLEKYGYNSGDIRYDCGQLETDTAYTKGEITRICNELKSEYEALRSEKDKIEKEARTAKERIQELEAKISAFAAKYRFTSEYLKTSLSEIKEKIRAVKSAQESFNKLDSLAKNNAESRKEFEDSIREFREKYKLDFDAITPARLDEISDDIKTLKRLYEEIQILKFEYESYKKDNSLNEKPETLSDEEYTRLEDEKVKLETELASLNSQIKDIDAKISDIPRLSAQKELLEEELSELEGKWHLYTETRKFLKEAYDNIVNKYLAPMKTSFRKYAELTKLPFAECFDFNEKFIPNYTQGGQTREKEHLSAGESAILSLCMRLALVENISNGERPLIILDDPFSLLDAENLTYAKNMLLPLSEKMQILYLTCHESRKI